MVSNIKPHVPSGPEVTINTPSHHYNYKVRWVENIERQMRYLLVKREQLVKEITHEERFSDQGYAPEATQAEEDKQKPSSEGLERGKEWQL